MSTVAAVAGQQNVMLAVFVICAIALVPVIALPYRQIASNVRGE